MRRKYRVLYEVGIPSKEVISKEMVVTEKELRELQKEVEDIELHGYYARVEEKRKRG